jgi:riboflavin transporter 2
MASHEKEDVACPPTAAGATNTVNRWVYCLFIVFGFGSWITINGLFAEIRLFSDDLPEKEKIYADLGLTIQLANIAPLLYGIFRPAGTPVKAIVAVLGVGAVAIAATGMLWQHTAVIAGKEMSIALIGGIFVSAAVDCTTTLLFWPFAAEFKAEHVTALAVGEGATGIVATVLVLIQLRGNLGSTDLLFSVSVYFALMAVVVLLSLGAFGLLITRPCAQAERVQLGGSPETPGYERLLTTEADDSDDIHGGTVALANVSKSRQHKDTELTRHRLFHMLAWLSALQNGVKTSVMPYAVTNSAAFEAAQLAGLCVDPLGGLVALWFSPGPRAHIALVTSWTACIGLLLIAALSPRVRHDGGLWVFPVASIMSSFLLAYSKASALLYIKKTTSHHQVSSANGEPASTTALFRAGVWIQSGSFVGSMLMWLLVNYTAVFSS